MSERREGVPDQLERSEAGLVSDVGLVLCDGMAMVTMRKRGGGGDKGRMEGRGI